MDHDVEAACVQRPRGAGPQAVGAAGNQGDGSGVLTGHEMNFPPRNITGLPQADKQAAEHSRRVVQTIHGDIADHGGRIPFHRFMHLALYAPGLGYYVAGQQRFGAGGDFVTAPELGSLFGRCLGRQAGQVIDTLGGGEILEFGAGSGRLAAVVLEQLERADRLPQRYAILEPSPDLRKRQRETLRLAVPRLLERVAWLDALPGPGFQGVVIANEVLDAMPVELFEVDTSGHAWRFDVVADGDGFAWERSPAPPDLAAAITRLELPPGYASELNPALAAWVGAIAAFLQRGVVLLFDYGFPRHEYYHPQRSGGTLMCHYRHQAHPDPLCLAGIQDITAHVDFTAVAEAAVATGLQVAGFTNQANFLLASGLTECVAGDEAGSDTAARARASHEIQTLTSPAEMGELFKAMALTRGYPAALAGFQLGDRRGRL